MKRYRSTKSKFQSFSVRKLERKSRDKLIFSVILAAILLYFSFTWLIPTLVGQLSIINRLKSGPHQKKQVENASLAPPVLNIPYEATNTATIKISGFAQPNTKVDIYVDDKVEATIDVGEDGTFMAENIPLLLGVNNINGKTVDEKGSKSLSSKTIRIIYDNQKPRLEVSSPQDGQVIKGGDKKTTVSGVTEPGNDVWVNNIKVIVDFEGNFKQSIEVNDGENNLEIKASDKVGNTTILFRQLIYQP